MNFPTGTRYFIVLGMIFSAYVCYALVMMTDSAVPWWSFAYGILFSVCMICGWGLWNGRAWAWQLSLILAAANLGLGGYFAHFAWTFWIFQEPTFLDRIVAVLHPRILIFTAMPVAWLIYFARARMRSCFPF